MAAKTPDPFKWTAARIEHRDNLPHVRQENVIYFVTFRLADSLPADRVAKLKEERENWLLVNPPPHTPNQQKDYRSIWTVRIENLLDAGYGECVLRDRVCRGFLETILRHDDGVKYQLGEYVIMPNHVHALVHMLPSQTLGAAIGAWKSISARRIGKHLGRGGSYWMDEYFDHAVRDDASLKKFAAYIRKNPAQLAPGTFTLGCGTLNIK